jgi:hypothetical protein
LTLKNENNPNLKKKLRIEEGPKLQDIVFFKFK